MATDATGNPTSLGIPKFNTAVDSPSGLGSNAQMDAIDALIVADRAALADRATDAELAAVASASVAGLATKVDIPGSIAANEVPVWNGSAWVRSSTVRINNGGETLPKVTQSAFASGPPGSPSTGDEWIALSVLGSSAAWRFVYRPEYSGSDDWLFVGGAPYSVVSGAVVSTASASFTVIDGTAPSVTLPRAGDYYFTMGARIGPNAGDTGEIGLMDDGSNVLLTGVYGNIGAGVVHAGASMNSAITSIGAGSVMAMWHRAAAGSGAQFYMRYLSVVPIRVS